MFSLKSVSNPKASSKIQYLTGKIYNFAKEKTLKLNTDSSHFKVYSVFVFKSFLPHSNYFIKFLISICLWNVKIFYISLFIFNYSIIICKSIHLYILREYCLIVIASSTSPIIIASLIYYKFAIHINVELL